MRVFEIKQFYGVEVPLRFDTSKPSLPLRRALRGIPNRFLLLLFYAPVFRPLARQTWKTGSLPYTRRARPFSQRSVAKRTRSGC